MIKIEDGRLLNLKGTFAHTQNVVCISHHDVHIIPSSPLWHAIFDDINYENICLLRNNGVSGLPTIPRKLKQCDSCILGKHNKQLSHDSTSRECRKLELIHSYFCITMPIPCENGNKYIIKFIDDYTIMCWVYLLK